MATFIPTKKCNLRCKHCLRGDYDEKMMDIGLFERFIVDCNNYDDKKRNHCFTGGEPTVYDYLGDAFNVLRKHRNKVSIITNGQEKSELIIENKDVINGILISLDSGNKETNDMVRGGDTFDNAINNAKKFRDKGIRVEFKICLHKNNYHTIPEAFELANALDVKRLSFSTVMPVNNMEKYDLHCDNDIMYDAYFLLQKTKLRYKNVKAGMVTRHFIPYIMPGWIGTYCNPMKSAISSLVLLPNGDVSFCCDLVDNDYIDELNEKKHSTPLSAILGNYNDIGFAGIINNKMNRMKALRHRRGMSVARRELEDNHRQFICNNCKYYHKS